MLCLLWTLKALLRYMSRSSVHTTFIRWWQKLLCKKPSVLYISWGQFGVRTVCGWASCSRTLKHDNSRAWGWTPTLWLRDNKHWATAAPKSVWWLIINTQTLTVLYCLYNKWNISNAVRVQERFTLLQSSSRLKLWNELGWLSFILEWERLVAVRISWKWFRLQTQICWFIYLTSDVEYDVN